MKRTLLILLVFSCSICAWAKIVPGVKLQFVSGENIIVHLDEEPLFTFEKDDVVIITNNRILRCAINELIKFTHINVGNSAIENVESDNSLVYFTDDGISASNLKPRSEISVYTQDGRLVRAIQSDDTGSVNAQFQVQENVVYIIKTSVSTFKMIKP